MSGQNSAEPLGRTVSSIERELGLSTDRGRDNGGACRPAG